MVVSSETRKAVRRTIAAGLRAAAFASAVALVLADPRMASAACSTPPGDVTGDGKVNVADAQCIVVTSLFVALGSSGTMPTCLSGGQVFAADFNCDGNINVSDASLNVQVVLKNPLAVGVDADANFCPDACQTPVLGGPPVVIPTYFYGTATGGGLTVRPLAPGSTATGSSSGGGLVVKPKAVGQTGN